MSSAVATMDRPWYAAALAAGTAQDMLRAYAASTTSALERVAPIGRVLEAAVASDPEGEILTARPFARALGGKAASPPRDTPAGYADA